MSIKFTSRFSPSIVRAAQLLEMGNALADVPATSELKAKATDSFNRAVAGVSKLIDGSGLGWSKAIDQVIECQKEMKAERRIKGQQRKQRREQLALEREEAMFA